jgi:hypothetical protein
VQVLLLLRWVRVLSVLLLVQVLVLVLLSDGPRPVHEKQRHE